PIATSRDQLKALSTENLPMSARKIYNVRSRVCFSPLAPRANRQRGINTQGQGVRRRSQELRQRNAVKPVADCDEKNNARVCRGSESRCFTGTFNSETTRYGAAGSWPLDLLSLP